MPKSLSGFSVFQRSLTHLLGLAPCVINHLGTSWLTFPYWPGPLASVNRQASNSCHIIFLNLVADLILINDLNTNQHVIALLKISRQSCPYVDYVDLELPTHWKLTELFPACKCCHSIKQLDSPISLWFWCITWVCLIFLQGQYVLSVCFVQIAKVICWQTEETLLSNPLCADWCSGH